MADLDRYQLVVLHFLGPAGVAFLRARQRRPPVAWVIYGGDVFDLAAFERSMLLPLTRRLDLRLRLRRGVRGALSAAVSATVPRLRDLQQDHRERIAAMRAVDALLPIIPSDGEALRAAYGVRAPAFGLNYVHQLLARPGGSSGPLPPASPSADILIGNSATLTSNHLDAIDRLRRIDPHGTSRVVIPLNYGSDAVAEAVEAYAKSELGADRVTCLRQFLPYDEYTRLVEGCGIIVMNHLRQQGFGTVVQAFLHGRTLYLHSRSPLYRHLVGQGFALHALDRAESIEPLPAAALQKNRELVPTLYGAGVQHARVQRLLAWAAAHE